MPGGAVRGGASDALLAGTLARRALLKHIRLHENIFELLQNALKLAPSAGND